MKPLTHVLHRDTLLSLGQAARFLGVSPHVLSKMASRGRLPYVTLAGSARPIKRFRKRVLEGLLVEHDGGMG